MMRTTRLTGLLIAVTVGAAQAQTVPRATSVHLLTWDQTDQATTDDLTYESAIDGAPYGPLLALTCTGASPSVVCRSPVIQSLTPGRHTAAIRAVRVIDGIRRPGQPSAAFAFDMVADPSAPGRLRLEVPPGATGVAVHGTIRDRYPFAGLDVASVALESGGVIYLGAPQLSTAQYSVRVGDGLSLVLFR